MFSSKRKYFSLIVALLAAALLAACATPAPMVVEKEIEVVVTATPEPFVEEKPVAVSLSGAEQRTIILSAFTYQADDGMWLGESGPFLNQLVSFTDISSEVPFCAQAVEGSLYGQPVSIVTMGVGKVHAATCMTDLLYHYGGADNIKDIIWAGISGFTPKAGDVKTVIGDVCISPIAVDYDLHHSTITEETDEFWLMRWSNPAQLAVGSFDLAGELYRAGQKVEWPPMPEGSVENVIKYHGEGTVRLPKVFHWKQCSEATGDNFWHSPFEDEWARKIIAEAISKSTDEKIDADDIIAVTAMEQTGWMNAVEVWNETTGDNIPFAYSRSNSNFDQSWDPEVSGAESIAAGMDAGGASYGSITAALPVLKMLELREIAEVKLDYAPRIAVVSAFEAELQLLLQSAKIEREYVLSGTTYHIGTLAGNDVVMFLSGVSMVNAAMTTKTAIDYFNLERIVYSGIAGGVNPELNIGDVTAPRQWGQYLEAYFAREMPDGNFSPPPWYTPEFPNFGMIFPKSVAVLRAPAEDERVFWFPVDDEMLAIAQRVALEVDLDQCTTDGVCLEHDPKVKVGGNGVSGQVFIDNAAFRKFTWETFHADALDMETSAVGHIAYTHGIPYIAFRSLSDLAGGGPGENQIQVFFQLAANNSAHWVLAFLEEWSKQ